MSKGMCFIEIELELFPLTWKTPAAEILFKQKTISIKTTSYRYFTTAMAGCQVP